MHISTSLFSAAHRPSFQTPESDTATSSEAYRNPAAPVVELTPSQRSDPAELWIERYPFRFQKEDARTSIYSWLLLIQTEERNSIHLKSEIKTHER